MKHTAIIVGTNTITRHLIPWERNDADYFIFNECGSLRDEHPDYWAKRCDAVIQMHAPFIWRNTKNLNHVGHYAWLQKPHDYPIYMQEVYKDVPASVKYPRDEIISKLLPVLQNEKGEQVSNFTSTVAYAIALALYQGYKSIELYGIEANSDTEYGRQKPGILFWIGVASGLKVPVLTQSKSLLLAERPYGYTGEIMIQRQEFENSFKAYQQMVKQAEASMMESTGKVKTLFEQFCQTKSQDEANRIGKEMVDAMADNQDKIYAYGELAGKMMENRRYISECDALIKAAGGEKALIALQQTGAQA
jgi:hypothetical protein